MPSYRVTNIKSQEVEVLNSVGLQKRFAPDLSGDSLESAKARTAWRTAFTATPAIQAGFGVSVEEISAREVFEAELAKYKEEKAQLAKTKARQDAALVDVFKEITEDELKEGKIHKLSKASKQDLSIVELYLSKGTPVLDDLLATDGLPTHVVKELKRVKTERKKAAAKRATAKA